MDLSDGTPWAIWSLVKVNQDPQPWYKDSQYLDEMGCRSLKGLW